MTFLIKIITAILLTTQMGLTACTPLKTQTEFNIGYSAHKTEPVFIERVLFDDRPTIAPGIVALGWKAVGKSVVPAPPYPPIPAKIFIRWFNYKRQTFYEATVFLPRNASNTLTQLKQPRFGSRMLVTGVLPNGGAVVWVTNGLDEKMGTWIELARAQGRQVEGDPDEYCNSTAGMRKRGQI